RNGFDVCRHLRKSGINTPILMLTARTELNSRVQGFKSGSNNYLTKPFETPNLQARAEPFLRRAPAGPRPERKVYEFNGIHVDFVKGRVTKNGKATELGERECRLLRYLVERKARSFHAMNSFRKSGDTNPFP